MGLFTKKNKPKQKSIIDMVLEEMSDGPKGPKQHRRCPQEAEILVATNSCICVTCDKRGNCAFENMARSSGCIGGFITYCSKRAADKAEETKTENPYKWADHALRDWTQKISAKYDISPLHVDIKDIKKEDLNGKKERERHSTELSGVSEPDIRNEGN